MREINRHTGDVHSCDGLFVKEGIFVGKVSVIIPCYNVKREYLEDCINSLVNQTLSKEKLELIFVNDASTDGTLFVLLEYEKQYPELMTVIDLSENLRQGGARNVGMQYATGDYIAFCDADDWVEPDMYEKMLSAMEAMNVDCVCCGEWNEYVSILTRSYSEPITTGLLDLSNVKYKKLVFSTVVKNSIWSTLYSKKFLEENNIFFPEKIRFEDNFFGGIVSLCVNRVYIISEPYYHYRYYDGSTCHVKNDFQLLEERLQIDIMLIEEYLRRGLLELYYFDVEYSFIKHYFIDTLFTLIASYDTIPEGFLQAIQDTVKSLFPYWKNNVVLHSDEELFLPCKMEDGTVKQVLHTNTDDWKVCQLIDYPFVTGDMQELVYAMADKFDVEGGKFSWGKSV